MAGTSVCRVQQLVSQAKTTFSLSKSEPKYTQELQKLKTIMHALTASDFNLTPTIAQRSWDYPSLSIFNAPAAFLDIYECNQFSVAIFLLKANKQMPLHDHPGMFGLMKTLFGSMKVTSYNKPPVMTNKDIPCLTTFSNSILATPSSDLCTLSENQGNIHEIQAQEGPVAFLDILTPPYNPSEGRDCIYYTRQQPPSDLMTNNLTENSVWLKPGSNPSWFTCVPQEYKGPKIS